MKTQMKKIALFIVMILAFCGGAKGQDTLNAPYQISFLGKNGWIVNDNLSSPYQASRSNFKNIDLIAVGGDTICARVIDSTGAVVYATTWERIREGIRDTLDSDALGIFRFVAENTSPDLITTGCQLQLINDTISIPEIGVNRKFYVAPAILDSANIGGKNGNSQTLKLSDFKVFADLTSGGDSAYYNNIQWYRNDTLVQSGMDTTYVANTSGVYSIKVSVLFKTRQVISSTLIFHGQQIRWFESNKLTINIANSLSNDATLSDLTTDGNVVDGFTSDIYTYNVELPVGTTIIPVVTAATTDTNATMEITYATSLPGTTIVTVTAQDGTTQLIYTINYTVAVQTYIVTFDVVGANGTLIATIDGVDITSPATVEVGKTVVFTAIPAANFVVKEWKLNGIVIVGNSTNNYTLNTLAANDIVTVEFKTTSDINEITKNVVKIYPIPATDFLYFSEEIEFQIYSITGREICRGTASKIDVSNFAKGTYILKTATDNRNFIVQ